MDRRHFLTTSLLAGAASLPGLRVAAADAAGRGGPALAAAREIRVGAAKVIALSDGYLPIDAGVFPDVGPEEFARHRAEAFLRADTHQLSINAFLIETGGTRTLVDMGTGPVLGETLGKLAGNMDALGIDPKGIDSVFITHLHPDHVGGVLGGGGNPYTGASMRVSRTDLDFWRNPDMKAAAPEATRPFFDMAVAATDIFGERIETFGDGDAIAPGVTAVALPGHTPGHSGVMIESDGDSLLIWGDLVHVAAVQLPRPEVTISFDVDPDIARETRLRVLDMVATDRLRVAGAHLGFPGIGYLERAGGSYRLVGQPWQYS